MAQRAYLASIIVCMATGLTLIGIGFEHGWYTVPDARLHELSSRLAGKPRDVRFREWYAQLHRWETPRKSLQDAGIGLVASALALLGLWFLTGFPLAGSKTPSKRWHFVLLYLGTLAAQGPAAVLYYTLRQSRHEYPAWGDTIVIGIFGEVFVAAMLAVSGLIVLIPLMYVMSTPAKMYAWPAGQRAFNVITAVAFGFLALAGLLVTVSAVPAGHMGGVLFGVCAAYLSLSVRAGLVKRRAARAQQGVADSGGGGDAGGQVARSSSGSRFP